MIRLTFSRILAFYALYEAFQAIRKRIRLASSNKAIVVTGCDTGFGRQSTLQLAKRQVVVYAGCLFNKSVMELKELKNEYIRPFLLDVTNDESVSNGFIYVKEDLINSKRELWALVNNAGVLRGGFIDSIPLKDWQFMMNVNVFGIVRTTKIFLPLLRKTKGGARIINIASVAGYVALPNTDGYSATKFAVEGLSEAWRRELKQFGLKIIIIEPGITKTPLWEGGLNKAEIIDKQYNGLPDEIKDIYGEDYVFQKQKATWRLINLVQGNPQRVVNAIEAAVISKYPQHRYCVGYDTIMWKILHLLPTFLSDIILQYQEAYFMENIRPASLMKKINNKK